MSSRSIPEYALFFSGDAVHLQCCDRPDEAGPGRRRHWRLLGSVPFESPDFAQRLGRLRAGLGPAAGRDDLPVTLVIPDDQILYTTLTVAPSADRERAVGRALDGLTPYAIEDLAFDWEGDGDTVRVAAVARQTLREAREFAAEYGFDGRAFCAAPEGGLFAGEPVFVLDPPARARPVFDPARVSVTAPELMIDAPGPEDGDEAPAAASPAASEPPEEEVAGAPGEDLLELPAELSAELPADFPAEQAPEHRGPGAPAAGGPAEGPAARAAPADPASATTAGAPPAEAPPAEPPPAEPPGGDHRAGAQAGAGLSGPAPAANASGTSAPLAARPGPRAPGPALRPPSPPSGRSGPPRVGQPTDPTGPRRRPNGGAPPLADNLARNLAPRLVPAPGRSISAPPRRATRAARPPRARAGGSVRIPDRPPDSPRGRGWAGWA